MQVISVQFFNPQNLTYIFVYIYNILLYYISLLVPVRNYPVSACFAPLQ